MIVTQCSSSQTFSGAVTADECFLRLCLTFLVPSQVRVNQLLDEINYEEADSHEEVCDGKFPFWKSTIVLEA